MAEPLTREQVLKVARLSRLALPEEKVDLFAQQLADILGYVEQIAELDVEGVEPMAHPGDLRNRLDEDEVGSSLSREDALRNAPQSRDGFLVVPKVLGGEGAEP
jgi:aspartyl-tRNA(Asn)/glutamyl-tRNA(Gln) amidotransferase subunit C